MQYRAFGRTNLKVSEIGYGAWAIGGGMWGPPNDAESLNALRRAIDLGVSFVDTAAVYGKGHSEQLVGKVWRERNRLFTVATKIPPKNWQWPAKMNTPIKEAFPKEWVREQTEKSLRNLRMDSVDLQQLHVWSPNWIKESDWYEEMLRLKEEGKIRWIGVSLNDHQPTEAVGLAQSGMADTVQVIYNIFDQSPEDQLFSACQKENVGVIARSPLDEGSLTGKFNLTTKFIEGDWRKDYFAPPLLKETVERVESIKGLFKSDSKDLTNGALKFCLSHAAVSTVIPGIRTVRQAEENCSASDGALLRKELLESLKNHRWIRG